MLMRRPRAGLVTQPPGGPGQPSAGITTGCLEWLHVTATTERWPPLPNEAPFEGGVCRCTEARLKGTQNAAGGAPEGAFLRSQGGTGRS